MQPWCQSKSFTLKMNTLSPDLFWAWVDSGLKNARWGAHHIQRASECFSCTLYPTVDKVPSTFLLSWSPFVKEKYTKEFQACTTVGAVIRQFRSLFSLLGPLLDSTTLSFSQVTRLYKVIEDSTIVCDASLYHRCTDLQRGTSLFHRAICMFPIPPPSLLSMLAGTKGLCTCKFLYTLLHNLYMYMCNYDIVHVLPLRWCTYFTTSLLYVDARFMCTGQSMTVICYHPLS